MTAQRQPATRPRQPARLARVVWVLGLLAVSLVGAQFIWRGPVRALRDGHDFSMMYGAARVWLEGGNPYRFSPVVQALRKNGGDIHQRFTKRTLISLYPPTLYVVLAPLAPYSWPAARASWLLFNLVALAGLGIGVIKLSRLANARMGIATVTCILLMWAPIHTCLRLGQTSLIVAACIVLGLSAMAKRRGVTTGILLGLAVALKPHVGGLFVAYLILRRHWQAVIYAAGVVAVIGLVGVVRLEQFSPGWASDWFDNVRFFKVGGIGDPAQSNPLAYHTINMHALLHTFTDHRRLVNTTVYVIVGSTLLLAIRLAGKSSEKTPELAFVSVLAVASLLVVYHRFYDATLLLLPIVWVAARWFQKRRDRVLWISILTLVPFLVPGAAILGASVQRSWVPPVVSQTWWWRYLVMPHQVWALCGLMTCLLCAMAKEQRSVTARQLPEP